MTTDKRMLAVRETSLSHALEWFRRPSIWRGVHLGCAADEAVGPAGMGEVAALSIVDTQDDRECGVILFEQRARGSWEVVVPHLALRTFGSRTRHAFRLALDHMKARGAREAVYMFATVNTPVYALLRRMGLLTHYCLAPREAWMNTQWFIGHFQI